ncbi:MAG: hypothetical protein ACR2N6_02570 [Miltoncostaeaceae bacterium]
MPSEDPDAFLAWLDGVARSASVDAVVPLDEDSVRLLAERGAEMNGLTVVGPSRDQYRALCDKLTLPHTARSLDIDSPATIVVERDGPLDDWPPLPAIVKPARSTASGLTARIARTATERDDLVRRILDEGVTPLVQECVTGPRWVIHSVRGAGVFEHVTYRVGREWPRDAGLASVKTPEPTPPQLLTAARRLLDHVDYRGPSGISFIERDGRHHVHDVNLRLGGTTGASLHAGFDFPRRAVETALGAGGRPFSGGWRPGTYMRLDLEAVALRDALTTRRSGQTPGEVLRGIASVAVDPRGRLDPSPLDPLGVWPSVASWIWEAVRARTRPRSPDARARSLHEGRPT